MADKEPLSYIHTRLFNLVPHNPSLSAFAVEMLCRASTYLLQSGILEYLIFWAAQAARYQSYAGRTSTAGKVSGSGPAPLLHYEKVSCLCPGCEGLQQPDTAGIVKISLGKGRAPVLPSMCRLLVNKYKQADAPHSWLFSL